MTNPLLELKNRGQSVWYDNLNRDFIRTGALQRLVDGDGISGGTSNPSIFEKALSASDAYDDHLRDLVRQGLSLPEIYDALTTTDVQLSCDVFAPIYERTRGADGYASLEVSPEIANDTEATTRDAKRLFAALDRPNAMIKIPGTQPGLTSIEDCLADGVNINITLLFGVENYEQVAWAYIRALERRREAGLPIDRIASVASFFVSRVDTAADKKLEEIGRTDLSGKAGVANAKIAYAKFKEIRASDRWQALEAAGARVQRPLWASTSTKNPAYRDVIYADELIGPDTINTMPDVTMEAFRDHGVLRGDTLDDDVDGAFRHVETLEGLGIDFRALTDQLQVDGVRLFSEAFHKANEALRENRDKVLEGQEAGAAPGRTGNA
jgi:transaldolase